MALEQGGWCGPVVTEEQIYKYQRGKFFPLDSKVKVRLAPEGKPMPNSEAGE
jgi:hypothetical protein